MKFIKLLKDLRIDEDASYSDYEMFMDPGKNLFIRPPLKGSVPVLFDKWIKNGEGENKLEAIKKLLEKITKKSFADADLQNIKNHLITFFSRNQDPTDVRFKLERSSNGVYSFIDAQLTDPQEIKQASADNELHKLRKKVENDPHLGL